MKILTRTLPIGSQGSRRTTDAHSSYPDSVYPAVVARGPVPRERQPETKAAPDTVARGPVPRECQPETKAAPDTVARGPVPRDRPLKTKAAPDTVARGPVPRDRPDTVARGPVPHECPTETKNVSARGFTMMELLLVMAIIAVLSAISMPALKGFASTRRLKASAQTVRNLLVFARDMAITERTGHLVVLDLDREQCWLASSETFNPQEPLASVLTEGTTFRQNTTAAETVQQGLTRTGGILGVPQALEQQVTLEAVITNHNGQTAHANSGVEYVYFSPTASSEDTQIYLRNRQNRVMSVTVEAASGRVSVRQLTNEEIAELGFEDNERSR